MKSRVRDAAEVMALLAMFFIVILFFSLDGVR